jgi:predicted negative regulator of RcsB-dependent stress response
MKAEKRHQLEQNLLADWLGEQIEAARPYAGTIAVVALGGVAIIALAIYAFGSGTVVGSADWSQYFSAFNERDPGVALESVAKEIPSTTAGLWAQQSIGDLNASRGLMQLFSDRDAAKTSLEKAEEAYKAVLAGSPDAMLKNRARLGLAKVYEGQNRTDEAKKLFEEIAAVDKDSAIGKLAAQGVERLSNQRDVELLAWFAKQTPKRPSPLGGAGPGLPGMPSDLPDRPDLSLPGLDPVSGGDPTPGLNLEGIGSGATEPSGLEFPKPGDTPASGGTVPPVGTVPPAGTAPPEGTVPAVGTPEGTPPGEGTPAPAIDPPGDQPPAATESPDEQPTMPPTGGPESAPGTAPEQPAAVDPIDPAKPEPQPE